MRLARTAAGPAVVAGLFALTACGGTTTDTADPTVEPTPTEEPTESPDTDMGTDDTDTDAMSGEACVEGEWDADLAAAERRTVDSFRVGDMVVEPDVQVSGDTFITFDGSMMITEFDNQVTTITLAMEDDQEVSATATLDGSTTGTYTIDGDRLVIRDVDVSDLQSDVTAELGGEEYDLPGVEALGSDAYAVDAEFTYECSGDELRLTPVADVDLDELETGTDTGTDTDTGTGTGTDTGTDTDTGTGTDDDDTTDTGTDDTDTTTGTDDAELDDLTQVLIRRS